MKSLKEIASSVKNHIQKNFGFYMAFIIGIGISAVIGYLVAPAIVVGLPIASAALFGKFSLGMNALKAISFSFPVMVFTAACAGFTCLYKAIKNNLTKSNDNQTNLEPESEKELENKSSIKNYFKSACNSIKNHFKKNWGFYAAFTIFGAISCGIGFAAAPAIFGGIIGTSVFHFGSMNLGFEALKNISFAIVPALFGFASAAFVGIYKAVKNNCKSESEKSVDSISDYHPDESLSNNSLEMEKTDKLDLSCSTKQMLTFQHGTQRTTSQQDIEPISANSSVKHQAITP